MEVQKGEVLMSWKYLVQIDRPQNHIVHVVINGRKNSGSQHIEVFLPSWSPGSYLMREYARHVSCFKAQTARGETLFHKKKAKGTWLIDWSQSELSQQSDEFSIEYQVYCHELTVRTSHVDASHAFLHGPSYLMGIVGDPMTNLEIEFRFTPAWSKLSTAMEDISKDRQTFLYRCKNYDELLDTPVEIGCHFTDGFMVRGKEHHLAFYGQLYPHHNDLKKDMKTIVEHISETMGEVPYERYLFISHFVANLFGGLEHHNSTALQFDGRKFNDRKAYLRWLSLVAHEYFHTWNVKRIRPRELGPFSYTQENYTSMLWLAEGLTSFVDELFVLRSGLCNLQEYLDMQLANLKRYFSIPGKKFDSLEDSSFDAWIKLYRPHENSMNSTISYYLKGGIVFNMLHLMLYQQGKSIFDMVRLLWDDYCRRPEQGHTADEVLDIIKKISDQNTLNEFWKMISTTEDLDVQGAFAQIGIDFVWAQEEKPYLGLQFESRGENVFVKTVLLDAPAYQCGINAGDEIVAINGIRLGAKDIENIEKFFYVNQELSLLVVRQGQVETLKMVVGKSPKELQELKIRDHDQACKALTF